MENQVVDIYPLSPMQEGILFHSLLNPEDGSYFEQLSCGFEGELDIPAFERAWERVIDRHCALRTGFFWERRDKPFQVVFKQLALSWGRQSWSDLSSVEQSKLRDRFLRDDRRRHFDLSSRPLMRLALIEIGPHSYFFVWSFHHLLLDGWSVSVVLREVFAFYDAIRLGRELQLEPPRPYRGYISWLGRQDRSKAEDFWRRTLSGFRAPTAVSSSRPWRSADCVGDREGESTMMLPQLATMELNAAVRKYQVTLNAAVQSAWALLLCRYSGERDIVFGTTVSGRPTDLPGADSMVGLFINTLPVRSGISGGEPLISLWRRLHASLVEASQYDYAPLVDIHGWSEVPRGLPLFESLVVFENYPVDISLRQRSGNLAVRDVRFSERANFQLILMAEPAAELSLRVLYDADRYDVTTILRLLGHLGNLLAGFTACLKDPGVTTDAIPMLAAPERQQILSEWNDTLGAASAVVCLQELFELRCQAAPEAVAVIGDGRVWTYREVSHWSNRMAHLLRRIEVGPGVLVGVQLERCPEMVPVLLAILKAGGAYVPLETSWPQARVEQILASTALRYLFTQSALLPRLMGRCTPLALAHVITIDEVVEGSSGADWQLWQPQHLEALPSKDPPCQSEAGDLAYVIFTSGSTGAPKGVMVRHRPVLNLIDWVNSRFSVGPSDRVLCVASLCFDLSVYDIFGLLAAGGSIRVASVTELAEPETLVRILCSEPITFWDSAPAALQQLAPFLPTPQESEPLYSLRLVFLSGDWIPLSLPGEVRASFPQAEVISLGGATEATVWSNVFPVRQIAPSWISIPYGRPIRNAEYHVLEGDGQVCPIGIAGDLYIGGRCLSSGYLGEPVLTASKYIPDSFSSSPGAVLYKTGDRARYWPDGHLEFLGRLDHQVKIRGFRIELGEIESCLGRHPHVEEAVLLAREDEVGQRRLVAYVVPTPEAVPDAIVLRSFLQDRLPPYMLPAVFVFLDSFPVTANGKLDRRALPTPGSSSAVKPIPTLPGNPVEELIVGAWAEVLSRESVELDDDFFELGGQSILATQVVSRLRRIFQVDLPLRTLFEAPTPAALARGVSALLRGGAASPALEPGPRLAEPPLSFAQERLWMLERMSLGNAAYHIPAFVRIEGLLDVHALAASLGEILRRHEILRTRFVLREELPVQVIDPPTDLSLPLVSLADCPDSLREGELQRLAATAAGHPFDLENGPLFRAFLLRLAGAEHVLLATMHHAVSDGPSIEILIRELGALYAALRAGHGSPLPEPAFQYADFAVWQRRHLLEIEAGQRAYWRERLEGAPPLLELPLDRPRPAVESFRGTSLSVPIDEAVVTDVVALAARAGVTRFMAWLALFQALLQRLCRQDDLLVGIPFANRERSGLSDLIGLFVNTLVIRTHAPRTLRIRELLRRVREAALGAYAHADLPFERLLEELQPQRSLSHHPLFQVLFTLERDANDLLRQVPGLDLGLFSLPATAARLDLSLYLTEGVTGTVAMVEYRTDLFDGATIGRLLGHLATLASAATKDPDRPLGHLPLLAPEERQQLVAWSTIPSAVPDRILVHEIVAARAAATPDAVAVVCGEERLSYGDLDRQATRLAHRLHRLGVGPEIRVGVCLDRSPVAVASLLAIFKAGGAYVPLDPTYPKERLAFIAEDAGISRVITESRYAGRLPLQAAAAVLVDAEEGMVSSMDARESGEPWEAAGMHSLAYLIYTSGSTGLPKGVAVEHGSLGSVLSGVLQELGFGPGDSIPAIAPFSFDISLFEVVGSLLAGGTCRLLPERPLDLPHLLSLLEDITFFHAVPALMREVVEAVREEEVGAARFGRLRTLLVGGDRVPPDLVEDMRSTFPAAQVRILYGPTESTIVCASCRIPASGPIDRALIGQPLPGAVLILCDEDLELVPQGVVGEICVGGAGVARGYWNRDDLTRERFVEREGQRFYRTGDLARRLADGTLEFLGRADHQVKIRGFRLDPGEIEAALREDPAVQEAVVVATDDGHRDLRLVAYVVLALASELPGDSLLRNGSIPGLPARSAADLPWQLRDRLAERLPDFMVPSAIVILEALPLTSHGKIDRNALPPPDSWRLEEGVSHAPPSTSLERELAGIWSEVLGVSRIGIHDDFFQLGGHSLLAIRVLARIRKQLGVELSLRQLFESPTVSRLAGAFTDRRGESLPVPPPLNPAITEGPPPLSFSQERLWFLDRMEPGSSVYNVSDLFRLEGDLPVLALERGLTAVVRRHEALRTRFAMVAGEPVQVVEPPQPWCLPVIDLSGLPLPSCETELWRVAAAEAWRPFDLEAGPLLRTLLLNAGEDARALLFAMHHIVSDAWSMGVLVRDLASLLHAGNGEAALPPLPVQYADYAIWQRTWLTGAPLEARLAYWRRKLADSPPALALPTDHTRPTLQTFHGAFKPIALSPARTAALREHARCEGATPFMVLLSVWQTLLFRLTGQADFCVGTPVAGRDSWETENLVGLFVNTLVLRADLAGEPTFHEVLARTREVLLAAQTHRDVPLEKLIAELHPQRDLSHAPLFQVLCGLHNAPRDINLPGACLKPLFLMSPTAKLDLSLLLSDADETVQGGLEYNTDLFESVTLHRWAGYLDNLLDAALVFPGRVAAALPMLSEAETHQLLQEWCAMAPAPPVGRLLHELVADQAQRTPGAVALVDGERRITYGELGERTGHLARRLRALGVGAETRVGVCSRRTAEMVMALLAVLEAGGAYVPLDPAYPAARLAFTLADSQAAVLLTQAELRELLPKLKIPVLLLEEEAFAPGGLGGRAAEPPTVFPENLAYLIYTSGSTGRPKGVAIEHRSTVAFLHWAGTVFEDADLAGVFASTSICFDLSVFEIFAPLTRGGTVILAADALALPELPAAGEVTLVNTVPSAAVELVRLCALPPSARVVNLAGEPLRRDLAEALYKVPGIRAVLNLYGPSEDTTYSTCAVIPRNDRWQQRSPSVGRPVAGTRAYVLDTGLLPVSTGAIGQLFLGGAGLARGYLNRPELTAERFIPDPYGLPGERLYRTGDLVRYRHDASLDFLGRGDHQVKIRGFRIEMEEIEVALARHPTVREAVVVAAEKGTAGLRLIAYVVPDVGAVLSGGELRALLGQTLPGHMIPATFVSLESIPRTLNGKVDRRALPEPESTQLTGEHLVRTPIEEIVAGIWTQILGVAAVSGDDDFFALGGHSLLAIRVVSQLQERLGIELALRSLFQYPTLTALAMEVERKLATGNGPGAPPIERTPRGDEPLPMSFAQERLWFLDRLQPGSPIYNVNTVFLLRGPLDVAAMAASLGAVMRRHESLRTRFVDQGQVILPPLPVVMPRIDLQALPAVAREAEAQRQTMAEARLPFDLCRGPLLRALVVALDTETHLLAVTLHHIICDGWSLHVLMRELKDLYDQSAEGQIAELQELPIQYADFAQWQRRWLQGEVLEAHLKYWERHLSGAPPMLALPFDRPRPQRPSHRGSLHRFTVSPEVTADLKALGRSEGSTLFMILLASWAILLERYSGQQDIVIGSGIANRHRRSLEGLIGLLANIVALRIDLNGDPSVRELLARVREAVLGAHAYQDLPFEKLVETLRPERDAAYHPIFQVMLVLQEATPRLSTSKGLDLVPVAIEHGSAKFDLTLFAVEEDGGITMVLEYSTDLFAADTIVHLASQLGALLGSLPAFDNEQISALDFASAAQEDSLAGAFTEDPEL